jgi:Raf kinase inhibitor-like YbhB/YbcL family protein
MKKLAVIAVLMSTIGAAAQTPAAPAPTPTKPRLTLTTTAFEDGGVIPDMYTQAATGTPVSPHLVWSNVPDGTVSFALLLIDPDTALMKKTDQVLHWMIFNIPGTARELPQAVPAQAQLPDGSIQSLNQSKKVGYMGMGAAAVGPYHHYTFELYALDTKLSLGPDATQADVMNAMEGHILMKGVLVGRFHRP